MDLKMRRSGQLCSRYPFRHRPSSMLGKRFLLKATRKAGCPNLWNPCRPLGLPPIYDALQADAFFMQGFNAARDRLFQIDLWRRRELGQLAGVLGSSYLPQGQATRLFP